LRRTMKKMRIRVALGVDCGWFLVAQMMRYRFWCEYLFTAAGSRLTVGSSID